MKNQRFIGASDIQCKMCEKYFKPKRINETCCSTFCKNRKSSTRYESAHPNLSSGTVGAMNELKACADLLQKGYEVFRAVSPSCSCDIAILKEGLLLRVEVRTGYENLATGRIYSNKPSHQAHRYDVLAIVLPNRIIYESNVVLTGELNGTVNRI